MFTDIDARAIAFLAAGVADLCKGLEFSDNFYSSLSLDAAWSGVVLVQFNSASDITLIWVGPHEKNMFQKTTECP